VSPKRCVPNAIVPGYQGTLVAVERAKCFDQTQKYASSGTRSTQRTYQDRKHVTKAIPTRARFTGRMPKTSVLFVVVAPAGTVAKFISGDGSPCGASLLPASHNSIAPFWNDNTRQEIHLVHDVFTLSELADYVLVCMLQTLAQNARGARCGVRRRSPPTPTKL